MVVCAAKAFARVRFSLSTYSSICSSDFLRCFSLLRAKLKLGVALHRLSGLLLRSMPRCVADWSMLCFPDDLPLPMEFSSKCRSSIRLKIFSSLCLMTREHIDKRKNAPTGTAKKTSKRIALKSTSVGGLASCISGVSAAIANMTCMTQTTTTKLKKTTRSSSVSPPPFSASFAALWK
uniref:Uncharacterized protein n=1 Tax=Chrysotila carterae TaxID=13221 RepID=A0A6S9WCR3_CHRCT